MDHLRGFDHYPYVLVLKGVWRQLRGLSTDAIQCKITYYLCLFRPHDSQETQKLEPFANYSHMQGQQPSSTLTHKYHVSHAYHVHRSVASTFHQNIPEASASVLVPCFTLDNAAGALALRTSDPPVIRAS
jgi:hypothetical protein